ncbi:hypothetical protein LEP1GSC047_2934 [Leptospira inadai serovar Lyme str. 10]|uniref:Tetratricopeptide repeat protein n=2 Tax=Leptospira inadai serovar Lyme TaxID=293084 RepID=V6HV07_9LEPT|nr:hypothetical protein [Leptospira inadai]EQA36644.1 hypothetical protein LEP1GSC047_2934 [Leptospira inadai serovar Lyme str. 10]PNV75581.1 hypothetical protein BES34_008085 [Leptospira inadai serovar Lyme]
MQVSASQTEWPEITLSRPETERSEAPVGTKPSPEVSAPSEVYRLKTKILENYNGSILTHLKPLDCFRSDLFGRFTFLSPRTDWIREDGITEREERLLRLFFEELLEELEGHVVWDSELFSLCSAFLLCEERLDEYKKLLNSFPEDLPEAQEGRILLFFLGFSDSVSEKTAIPIDFGLREKLALSHKKANLDESQKFLLYDLTVSGKEPSLVGLAYHYFRFNQIGLRTIKVLDAIVVRRWNELNAEEKDLFLRDYETRHSIWDRFFLLKKFKSKDEQKSWIRSEKRKNGREELSDTLRESILGAGDESLFERYEILREKQLVHTLRPFELLVLWNSTAASRLDSDLVDIEREYPDSYLIHRAVAVKEFKERKFEAFRERSVRTGRFQYSPEMIYLKAIALLETGEGEEGIKLLESLVYKFPDSDFLRLVLERYKKRSD